MIYESKTLGILGGGQLGRMTAMAAMRLGITTNIYKRFFTNWDEELYTKYLTKFNLSENKKIDELSKGMALKYSITLALSHHAELLILRLSILFCTLLLAFFIASILTVSI